jgi:Tfp pilus assembly protein PilX
MKPETLNLNRSFRSRQRGAALVVGLLLLVIITLLAITGMTTANTELIMAGNEQQRQNGFRAAETGVDQAILTVQDTPTTFNACRKSGVINVFGSSDRYTTATQYLGEGGIQAGWGAGASSAHFYAIRSRGAGARGAESEIWQGVVKIMATGGGGTVDIRPLVESTVNPVGECAPDELD